MADNAKPRDVQAGWEVFRSYGYEATLEKINARLLERGFGAVSSRTHTHYRKLHRYGYERYIPINVLDVETHKHPIWGVPLRSRYRSRPTTLNVQALFVLDDGILELVGVTLSTSDTEVILRLDSKSTKLVQVQQLDLEGMQVLLSFPQLDNNQSRAASVDISSTEVDSGRTLLTLSLLTIARDPGLSGRIQLSGSAATVSCDALDNHAPASLVRNLTALLDALDVARMLTDEALAFMDADSHFSLGPLTVEKVTVGSPILLDISAALPVIGLFWYCAKRFVKTRIDYIQGDVLHSQAQVGKATANSINADVSKKIAEAKLTSAQADYVSEITRTRVIQNNQLAARRATSGAEVASVVAMLLRGISGPNAEFLQDLSPGGVERIDELLEKQAKPAFEKLSDNERNTIGVGSAEELDELIERTEKADTEE